MMINDLPIEPPKISIVLLKSNFLLVRFKPLYLPVIDLVLPNVIRDNVKVVTQVKWGNIIDKVLPLEQVKIRFGQALIIPKTKVRAIVIGGPHVRV